MQDELNKLPYKVIPHHSGGVAVEVNYCGKDKSYSVEHVTAMLLTGLKETTEVVLKGEIKNCVIAVSDSGIKLVLKKKYEIIGWEVFKTKFKIILFKEFNI